MSELFSWSINPTTNLHWRQYYLQSISRIQTSRCWNVLQIDQDTFINVNAIDIMCWLMQSKTLFCVRQTDPDDSRSTGMQNMSTNSSAHSNQIEWVKFQVNTSKPSTLTHKPMSTAHAQQSSHLVFADTYSVWAFLARSKDRFTSSFWQRKGFSVFDSWYFELTFVLAAAMASNDALGVLTGWMGSCHTSGTQICWDTCFDT